MRRLPPLGQLPVCVALLVAGCDFAPDYHTPATPEVADWPEMRDWKPAAPADTLPRGEWWHLLGDPELDRLEAKVTSANQDIKAALARFEQARAAARVDEAAEYPLVTVNAQGSREQLSRTIANTRPQNLYNDFQIIPDLSYEVDLWGRVRNAVAAGRAQAAASAGDLAAMDLSTHAELATDYFTLRGDAAKLRVLEDAVAAYTKARDLTRNLYDGGDAVVSDLDQAEAQLDIARTQASDMRLDIDQMRHAIAILVGEAAPQFALDAAPLDARPPEIDPGLPGDLLERRPDIAAAERRVAAANAQIGVAEAAFFPTLSLGAELGVESAGLSHLITAPSGLWSFGPQASLPLFDGGQRNALSDQARAAYDETVADYRQSVLGAFRDVEDNLAALRRLGEEAASQDIAFAAAGRALGQARNRYSGGIVTYLEVVTTENTALQAELTLVDIRTRRMNATVALIKALGGGWRRDPGLKTDEAAVAATGRPG